MTVTTYTSRELNQNVTRAKQAAEAGPVFITDRGEPGHVLLSIDQYQRLVGQRRGIAQALAMEDAGDIEFQPPRLDLGSRSSDPL